jgi:hypothetical protein
MNLNYEEFIALPRSEKVTLAIAHATTQFKFFTLDTGDIYYKDVDHFVVGIKQGTVNLTEAESSTLSAGQWFFDAKEKRLYVRMSDDSNPKTKNVTCTFRFFFSDGPYKLPYDLQDGEVVEYESRIESIGSLGQQLDDQNTGIVLESSSNVTMINTDGYFDEIFDTLIWEHQPISFYSWSPLIPASEAFKLFDGLIESKDFSTSSVTFRVKDFVFKLKTKLNMPLFSSDDWTISPSMEGKPMRRIYGQVKQMQCTGVDQVLGGFDLTGTVSIAQDSETMTGTGTLFLSELSPGDEILVTVNRETYKFGIDSIQSNTSLTVGSDSDVNIVNLPATAKIQTPNPEFNRFWHIAGHKLRAPSTEITAVISNNRIEVDDTTDLYPDDSVKINDEYVIIKRISGNEVVLQSALQPLPEVGDLLEKNPVSKVYFKNKELVIDRDWVLHNNVDEAYLEINEDAEFNIVEPKSIGQSLLFTNGSRAITTSATVDFRSILKSRDWVRKNSITEATWYEVLDVSEQSITLRTPFTGSTGTATGYYKSIDHIVDDSLITVDTLGLEVDGEWIKTPAQAVRHLVTYDAEFPSVNESSFDKAKAECDYILSLPIPASANGVSPEVKSVITMINESVFGSLYGNSAWEVSYSILNSKKPEDVLILRDDDIISFDVNSDQKIINSIKVNYRPYVDIYSGEDSFESLVFGSEFVDRMMGVINADEKTIYLYEDDKAEIIAQRIAFFRSLSSCKVMVKAKLNLARLSVNDKVMLDLDRLYKRYGGRDRKKIGIVTGIKKNGYDTEIEFTDLGNIYNRVPAISPNTASVYSSATREEIALWGYVVDNDTLTPQLLNEDELGNNLIG